MTASQQPDRQPQPTRTGPAAGRRTWAQSRLAEQIQRTGPSPRDPVQAVANPNPAPEHQKQEHDMPGTSRTDRENAYAAARRAARSATHQLALDAGAELTTRPLFVGADVTTRDVEPLVGLQASHDLELAAGDLARTYTRQAREAGLSWHDIGTAMHLGSAGRTPAEAAFSYAAGDPDTHHARTYGRSIGWTCATCSKTITDHGLETGPADDERGHAPDCRRLARTIQAWQAEWEAGQ
jgi:hypothetical protein